MSFYGQSWCWFSVIYFSRLHLNLQQINVAQFIFSLSFGCLWLRNRTRRGKTVFPGVCLCRLGCVYACSCLVCFPVWALHGHKVWSHNSPLSRLPSTLPVMSEFTEIRTQGKQTAAATALGRRVVPSRRDPSTDGGCGWEESCQEANQRPSLRNQRKGDAFYIMHEGIWKRGRRRAAGLHGGGATQRFGSEKLNQEWWGFSNKFHFGL